MKSNNNGLVPVIKKSLVGFNDRIGVKRDIEDYVSMSLIAYMKKCGFRHYTAPTVEQQQYFSSEFVGSHPWPGWHPKSLFAVTVKDYNEAYEIPPVDTTQCFLIPEVTASLVRYVSNNLSGKLPTLQKGIPLKVYYAQSCFRNELTSKISERRLREFTQIGLEYMGQEGVEIDVEVFSVAVESLASLGFKREDVLLRINDVRIFNYLAQKSEFGMDEQNAFKSLLDEIASARIKQEKKLTAKLVKKFETLISEKSIPSKVKEQWRLLTSPYITPDKAVKLLRNLPKDVTHDLLQLIEYSVDLELNIVVDLSVVRSQEYYNSIVFQIDILGGKHITAEVGGGGRYDFFINKLFENQSDKVSIFPATGYAFSLERISMAIIYSGLMINRHIQMPTSGIDYVIEITPEHIAVPHKLASILREKGFTVDLANTKTLATTAQRYAQMLSAKLLPT